MDIDLLKSGAEDQMEMMLMMQMDKLSHEFSAGSYSDGSEMAMIDFSAQAAADSNNNSNNTGASAAEMAAQVIMNNSHVASSSAAFMNLPSTTISFTSSPHGHHDQDPSSCAVLPLFLSNSSSAAKWMRNGSSVGVLGTSTFGSCDTSSHQKQHNSVAAMREMIFRIAAMQPIHIDPESVKPPKRRNVKISKDPQSVAARHRRERISERIRILQRLVPGGTKMDTASMLDEAIHYVKFLKNQVQSLERAAANRPPPAPAAGIGFPVPMSSGTYLPMSSATKGYKTQNVQHYADA